MQGLLHDRLGDAEEAEHHWTRVVKEFAGTPEGLAAQFRLGSHFVRLGRFAEGVQRYRQGLNAAKLLSPFANMWLTKDEIETRMQASYEQIVTANEFSLAIEFSSAWSPLSEEHRGLLARANVHRAPEP